MRVITGEARGRKLKEVPGMDTRPTTDRVKESIFNIIQFDIEGRRVLDLFAGSGQLGIEALSRGAEGAVFVESRTAAAAVLRENLEHTKLNDRAAVVVRDAFAYLASAPGKFDVVFLDPPYRGGLLEKSLEVLAAIDIVSEHGIIVCESPREAALTVLPESWAVREYRYGNTKITLYRVGGSAS